jgi:UDP-N-acetylglucosamine 2-epimerase (non-hydrolysing)
MDRIAPVLAIFGTRPEVIKLMPVLRALDNESRVRVIRVYTGQQADLVPDFLDGFDLDIDESLDLMAIDQSLNRLLAKLIGSLDGVIERHEPAAVIVQGDTTTALAGALSARYRGVPVIHIEAGLRTGDRDSPFPEETNRRLISHVSSLHLAPTHGNVETLRAEGIPASDIILTGNPIVDAIRWVADNAVPSAGFSRFVEELGDARIVALTTHRRENFGPRLRDYLEVIGDFIASHTDTILVFPVHPNPIVRATAHETLGETERVRLIDPIAYADFICLLQRAWLVLSDSGGVQEEVVSLGKPLLVLREKTERPEAIGSGCVRLASTPQALAEALETAAKPAAWCAHLAPRTNPFGDGNSGPRIADAISRFLLDSDDKPNSSPP